MLSYTQNPSLEYCERAGGIFRGLLMQLLRQQQITQQEYAFCDREFFGGQYRNIMSRLWERANVLGRQQTTEEFSEKFIDLINQMREQYRQLLARQQYGQPPMYQQPMYNNVPMYQQQQLNTWGNTQHQQSLYSTPIQRQPESTSIYDTKSVVTDIPQITMPTAPVTINTATEKTVAYQAPTFRDETEQNHDGVPVDFGWAKGKLIQYKNQVDEMMDALIVHTTRGFVRPIDAINNVLERMRGHMEGNRFVVVKYAQLQAYDIERTTGVKAIEDLRKLVDKVNSSNKHAYLKSIIKYLFDNFNRGDSVNLESILINEFNNATLHGTLFDSDTTDKDMDFHIKTLSEIVQILDPDSNKDGIDSRYRTSTFVERLTKVARDIITRVIKHITVVDPNTPEGLDDYVAVYGNVVVDGYAIRDIHKYRMQVANASDAEKKKAQTAITKIMGALNSQTVIKIADKTAVYSTLSLAGMIGENFTICCGPVFVGGGSPAETDAEWFITTHACIDNYTLSMFFQPTQNVLFGYNATATTDGWVRLLPQRLS